MPLISDYTNAICVRVIYIEDGQEYGLEEVVARPDEIQGAIDFITAALKKDYNARRKGENTLWP